MTDDTHAIITSTLTKTAVLTTANADMNKVLTFSTFYDLHVLEPNNNFKLIGDNKATTDITGLKLQVKIDPYPLISCLIVFFPFIYYLLILYNAITQAQLVERTFPAPTPSTWIIATDDQVHTCILKAIMAYTQYQLFFRTNKKFQVHTAIRFIHSILLYF